VQWNGQPVAVKMYKSNDELSGFLEESFFREMKALSELRNVNNVVNCHGVGLWNNNFFLVLEKANYNVVTLIDRSRDGEEYFYKCIYYTCLNVVKALQQIEERGILHRDIRGSNLLWFGDHVDARTNFLNGTVKLCDFGLCKKIEDSQPFVCGYLFRYPEQVITDTSHFCTLCDIYMFGITMWEICCCGVELCDFYRFGIDLKKLDTNVVTSWRPPVEKLPSKLAQFLLLCWSHDPTKCDFSTLYKLALSLNSDE